jgi:hypothetical protein
MRVNTEVTSLEIATSAHAEAVALVANLAKAEAAARARAAAARAEREAIAFRAATGDEAARDQVKRLRAAETEANQEAQDAGSALVEAKKRLTDAERALASARAEEHLASARAVGERLLKASGEIDRLAAALVAAIYARNELVTTLAATRCLRPAHARRFWRSVAEGFRRAGTFRCFPPTEDYLTDLSTNVRGALTCREADADVVELLSPPQDWPLVPSIDRAAVKHRPTARLIEAAPVHRDPGPASQLVQPQSWRNPTIWELRQELRERGAG